MKSLTERQEEIFGFLVEYTKGHGYPPTVREIGDYFGFLWAAARVHLKALEKKGLIKITPSKSRGIEITGIPHGAGFALPVAGTVRAGRPVLAVEDIDAHILVDKSLFPAEGAFSLRIKGESMIDAGIFEGDYVIVRPQDSIENGEIGVVLLGDEATVKRVFLKGEKITLKPENRVMGPVSYNADEITVIGKVIGVIRKM